jgi:hypothetical protein
VPHPQRRREIAYYLGGVVTRPVVGDHHLELSDGRPLGRERRQRPT